MESLVQPTVHCAPPSTGAQAPASALPTRVGPYDVLSPIASGGMGTVCVARRHGEAGFSRLYAIKLLHAHLAAESQFVTMLLDEAHLSSRIHHANVVPVVDLGRDEGRYYVAMEYVEGVSLAQLLRRVRTQRPPHLLVPILVDVLEGLHAAHTAEDEHGVPLNLIHRDVSPQNVLVGLDGVARLIDFGVAKARSRLTSTQEGMLKGKLQYIAPELLAQYEPDPRADVWSAGVVAWSSLTARKLFGADNEVATMRNILDKVVPVPSEVGSRPPRVFDDIIMTALQRQLDDRYASAYDMAEDLREAAVASGLWGSRREIGDWIRSCFDDELENRRDEIRSSVSIVRGSTEPVTETPVRSAPAAPAPPGYTFRVPPPPKPRRIAPVLAITIGAAFLGGLGVASVVSVEYSGVLPVDTAAVAGPDPAPGLQEEEPSAAGRTASGAELDEPSGVLIAEPEPDLAAVDRDRLSRILDLDRLTDAEVNAALLLAFPTHAQEPCAAFDRGLSVVERGRQPDLIALLRRVAVPHGEACEGLQERVSVLDPASEPVAKRASRKRRKRSGPALAEASDATDHEEP